MVISRRAVLAGLTTLPLPAHADASLFLIPGQSQTPAQVSIEAARDSSQITFHTTADQVLPAITLPSPEVSLVGRLPLAGRDLLLASFVADPFVRLMVIIGWDGQRPRILDVEPASVQSAEGPILSLRMSATPDGQVLRLIWQLSAPRGPTLPFHDQWIDMLGFRPQAPLADVALRKPMPGGCQQRLATIRADVAAMLAVHPDNLTTGAIRASGLLETPRQLALAIGAAAYPAGMAGP